MLVKSVMFARDKVTAVNVDLLRTVGPARVVQIDEVVQVAYTAVVAEASGVAEVATVAGNSVEVAMVTVVEAIAVAGVMPEELVGTEVAVVWVPWAVEVVVGGTVADAVVAV